MAKKHLYFVHLSWLLFSFIVVVLDQFSKLIVTQSMQLGESKSLLPFLNFTLVHNQGAAFNFLSQAHGWQRWFFLGLAVFVVIGLLFWLLSLTENVMAQGLGIASIIGGALGNAIDRLRFGYVIDFIHFHFKAWNFAVFNLADSAIFFGVVLLLLQMFIQPKE